MKGLKPRENGAREFDPRRYCGAFALHTGHLPSVVAVCTPGQCEQASLVDIIFASVVLGLVVHLSHLSCELQPIADNAIAKSKQPSNLPMCDSFGRNFDR